MTETRTCEFDPKKTTRSTGDGVSGLPCSGVEDGLSRLPCFGVEDDKGGILEDGFSGLPCSGVEDGLCGLPCFGVEDDKGGNLEDGFAEKGKKKRRICEMGRLSDPLVVLESCGWRAVASSDKIWSSKCEELWQGKTHLPRIAKVNDLSKLAVYSLSIMDGKRKQIRKEDLYDHVWEFHFTELVGPRWVKKLSLVVMKLSKLSLLVMKLSSLLVMNLSLWLHLSRIISGSCPGLNILVVSLWVRICGRGLCLVAFPSAP